MAFRLYKLIPAHRLDLIKKRTATFKNLSNVFLLVYILLYLALFNLFKCIGPIDLITDLRFSVLSMAY